MSSSRCSSSSPALPPREFCASSAGSAGTEGRALAVPAHLPTHAVNLPARRPTPQQAGADLEALSELCTCQALVLPLICLCRAVVPLPFPGLPAANRSLSTSVRHVSRELLRP